MNARSGPVLFALQSSTEFGARMGVLYVAMFAPALLTMSAQARGLALEATSDGQNPGSRRRPLRSFAAAACTALFAARTIWGK